ncbi:Gfo/Idh/MocA family protein [Neobacillus muris]|uniref:Gfo/Idh/MocA family protein n=1 Tax=Neobacillus muris TaxID=2941334 RepID=UPI002041F6DD|nr:Gfo/Idh/MocA family oxidoreductase [Neobacillus muris]
MKANKIGVGVIGAGGVGEKVMEVFSQHPDAEIIGICDTNKKVLSKYFSSKINLYLDYRDLMDHENVDLVYIAVPPKFHYPVTIEALQKNKHVLCEKPLAHSLEEAEKMLMTAQKKGVIHAMNFPTFYRNAYKIMEEIVLSNRLGDIQRIQVRSHFPAWPRDWQQNNWINTRDQGGFIREIMPHYIQIIQHLFGPIQPLQSLVNYPEAAAESETGLMAAGSLKNGTPVVFDGLTGTGEKEIMEFTIYGTTGVVMLKDWNQVYFGEKNQGLIRLDDAAPINHLLDLVDHVLQAIKGNDAKLITFKEGAAIQQVLEELICSRR